MRLYITITKTRIALAALALVALAGAVSLSGLVSIAANTGHFAVVEWFLHSTMRNAVRTQSLPDRPPAGLDLADPALVQRAAGHFASGCAMCHGAPGVRQSPAVLAMMPPPPRLERRIDRWEDRELFWIVDHGIKYSGMPAWTTQRRPDEVWAMAAFLRALPAMDEETYRRLAFGESIPASSTDAGPAVPAAPLVAGEADRLDAALADCARCHGLDGRGVDTTAEGPSAAFPSIAGQPEAYLLETLRAYATGSRESGIMTPAAGVHSEETLAALARHYAAQEPGGPARPLADPQGLTLGYALSPKLVRSSVEAELVREPAGRDSRAGATAIDPAASQGPPFSAEGLRELGRRIATEGLPARKLASCESCHGATGRERNPLFPSLAGQPEWFIATQLQLFKERDRQGTRAAHLMEPIAIHLTDEQIDALALWYSLEPPG